MKFVKQSLILSVFTAAFAVSSYADMVVTTPGGGKFNDMPSNANFQLGGYGSTFFDTRSDDNPIDFSGNDLKECNVGALLTGTDPVSGDACRNSTGSLAGIPTGDRTWQYLSSASGAATAFEIAAAPDTLGADLFLQIEFAGLRDQNIFGYYVNGGPSIPLFSGADSGVIKTTIGLAPGDLYGFYLQPPNGATEKRSGDANELRFALFRPSYGASSSDLSVFNYVIGIEDGSDYDYQDMLVRVQVVPEPGSVLMLSGAVLGTLAMVRRRRNRA